MSKIIAVKTEGLEGDALKFAQSLNEALKDLPEGISKQELTTSLEKFKTDNPFPISKEAFEEMKETLNQLKEQGIASTEKASTMEVLQKEIKENKNALVKMIKGAGEDVALKATVARSSIATNPLQVLLPGVGQLIRIARSFYNICRKVNLPMGSHNGTLKYLDWDEATTVKAAAAVAEGGTFPESTATFKGYSIDLKKLGDTLPVNEEFFEDEVMAAAELEIFLQNNVESKIDTDLINADGTGDTITGLLTSISAYTPVASGIADANIYDLIVKVKSAITSAAGSKYQPDFALMNNNTIDSLLLKKDDNNDYLFPPNHPIFSMIVVDNNVADNVLVVGDSRFSTIYEMGGVTLSRGLVNTQFVKDQLTLKARKRMLFLIRNSDKSGFRKVTDITAALTTLATAP
jgi:cell fate (sporulation/competence/biofilm development) regulator YlbF (YheA/YmcA/DUF963 family)